MRDIENHVENFIEWLSEWGVFLPPPTLIDGSLTEDGSSLRTHLIKVSQILFWPGFQLVNIYKGCYRSHDLLSIELA